LLKAGLIGAIFGFIYVTSFNLISPFCTLCITPLLGLGVGYLAGWFDQPTTSQSCLSRGCVAGGITSTVILPGQAVATITNGIIVTNMEEWPNTINSLGLSPVIMNDYDYWQVTMITNTFCGLFNVAIIVGLAAFGSLIWFQKQPQTHK